MINRKILIGSLTGVVLLSVMVGGVATAYAQSDMDDGPPWPGRWGRGGTHTGVLSEFIDQEALDGELATALGMTPEEFTQARDDGTTLRELAEQNDVELADLRETQQEYVQQAIEQAIESGADAEWLQQKPGPGLGRFGPGGGDGILAEYIDHEALDSALAQALGISAEEFAQAREGGITLFEMADQYDVELAELRAIKAEYLEQAIEAAVDDGAIESELAERLEQMPGAGFEGLGRLGCSPGSRTGPRSGAGPGGFMRR